MAGFEENKKETVLAFLRDPQYRAMRFREIAGMLQVPKPERGELNAILDHLVNEGLVTVDALGRYAPRRADTSEGVFSANARGFGFVTVEGESEDWFIPAEQKHGAMHGDLVRVAAVRRAETGDRFRTEGRVVAVLRRNTKTAVGIFRKYRFGGCVVPDRDKLDFIINIPQNATLGAVTGQKVCAEITSYGDGITRTEGRVVEILGHVNDPGVDILSVVRDYDLPVDFPQDVCDEVGGVPGEVDEAEAARRTDLRAILTVTVDGEEAKDLDDAISLTIENGHYYLGVHIADVSNYVREGTPLDTEALKRGTSVYLADRVIPMLPHELSDGICSLNQGEDRLALSCLMELDEAGSLVAHSVEETVIRVDHRLSYNQVQGIFDAATASEEDFVPENEPCGLPEETVSMLLRMRELASKLKRIREARGAIDFDFPECKILMNEDGSVREIEPRLRCEATELIESFMVLANETVAEEFFWLSAPFLYRVHEEPSYEKMKDLAGYVSHFGYFLHLSNDKVHAKEIQQFLRKLRGKAEEPLLSRLTLRSMRQARYETECAGHFGLASKYYCHFTSPIRRYPDLQIHRIIKEHLRGGLTARRSAHYREILGEVAKHSSVTERRSDEVEREVEKMKKAEYMCGFLGEEFDGVISGVTSWGIYVELENTVEGLIRLTDLHGDCYNYSASEMSLRGERTGRRYEIGQPIRVLVAAADKTARSVDFMPVDAKDSKRPGKPGTPAKRGAKTSKRGGDTPVRGKRKGFRKAAGSVVRKPSRRKK